MGITSVTDMSDDQSVTNVDQGGYNSDIRDHSVFVQNADVCDVNDINVCGINDISVDLDIMDSGDGKVNGSDCA